MLMHPRVDYSPEQLGKAQEQWTRLLETRLSNMPHTAAVQNNCSNTPEFISLDNNNSHPSEDYHHDCSKRRRENRASTYNQAFSCQRGYTQPPWKPKGHRYSKGIHGLHEEILHFFSYMSPRPEEAAMRKDVVRRIESVIHETWPSAKVEIFGSFRTGLYLPTSDIDMVIFGKWTDPPLNTMERKLVESGICHPTDIKVLNNATVPIVKLVDKKTDVKVDISYNLDSGLKSANLITDLMEKYPYLKHLVMVLKQFLLERDLNEVFTGGVSSYSLILMVVSFLQLHPRQDNIMASPNLGVLLIEFFELYGIHFNYLNVGLRIRDGGSYVRKEDLMHDMDSGYKQNLLCIEDPLYPANDVGRSSYNVMHVKNAFKNAFNTLNHRVLRQYYYLYDEDESILSRIVHLTQDVQDYRRWISESFPLSPPASPYSYACAVKTGASPKDLNGVAPAAAATAAANGVVPAAAAGKSDGEESDTSSGASSASSSTSSMSRSSLSMSASACNTPPSSISSADSDEDDDEQAGDEHEASAAGVRSSSCTAAPALAPAPAATTAPAVQPTQPPPPPPAAASTANTPANHYRDAVLNPPPHHPRKSHSSNNRFRQQHHHHYHQNQPQHQQHPHHQQSQQSASHSVRHKSKRGQRRFAQPGQPATAFTNSSTEPGR